MAGAGGDTLDGGNGSDTASYYLSSIGVSVDLATGVGHGGDAEGDTLTGFEILSGSQGDDHLAGDALANTLQGWNGNDEIAGAGGNDTVEGGDGNDSLSGDTGADVLRGGAGADQLNGGDGSDTVSYYFSSIGVTVDLATGTGHGGDAEGDTLTGFEILTGSQGNDSLTGDALANTLQGWNGNDVLEGGIGKDALTGGAGADRFVFSAISDSLTGVNADRITDFSHAQGDKIDLSAIDAGTGVAGDQAFTFIGSGLYTHHAGELRFAFTSPGITTIAGDVNGDGASPALPHPAHRKPGSRRRRLRPVAAATRAASSRPRIRKGAGSTGFRRLGLGLPQPLQVEAVHAACRRCAACAPPSRCSPRREGSRAS